MTCVLVCAGLLLVGSVLGAVFWPHLKTMLIKKAKEEAGKL